MKTELSSEQYQKIQNYIDTDLHEFLRNVCEPVMSLDKSSPIYQEVYWEKKDILVNQAIRYINKNL